MSLGRTERLDEVLRLLAEQRDLLNHWPITDELIQRDKQLSARIRDLIDQLCSQQLPSQTTAGRGLFKAAS
jgi:hypothetical protein